jgi:hypothetical protein
VILIITKCIPKWKLWAIRNIPGWVLLCIAAGMFIPGVIYYSYASQGFIVRQLTHVKNAYALLIMQIIDKNQYELVDDGQTIKIVMENNTQNDFISSQKTTATEILESVSIFDNPKSQLSNYMDKQDPLIKAAVGWDFVGIPIEGKLFRIIQYITQALIVMGCVYLLFRYKYYKFNAVFIGGVGAMACLLCMCLFIPSFSSIINITRFYHLTLFFLAPMFILGVDVITREK